MENEIMDMREDTSEMMRNTSVSIDLSGWPAAVAIVAVCLSGVAIYGIDAWYKVNCNS